MTSGTPHRLACWLADSPSPLEGEGESLPRTDPGVRGKVNARPWLVCRRGEKGFRWIPACAGMTKVLRRIMKGKMFRPRKSRTDILPKFLIDPYFAVVEALFKRGVLG